MSFERYFQHPYYLFHADPMEWVPIFYFRLFVELGQSFDFPKGVFSRNKRICSSHVSQKASIFDGNRQNRFRDFFPYVFNDYCHIISSFYLTLFFF